MNKMFIYLFLLNILFAQEELKIEGYDHMPLHTKLLWGKSGLLRKLNLAPENRKDEVSPWVIAFNNAYDWLKNK